jgi:hypothetical protein
VSPAAEHRVHIDGPVGESPLRVPVAEPHPPAALRGVGGRQQEGARRARRERPAGEAGQHAAVGAVEQLAHRLLGRVGAAARLRGHEQGGELLGRECDLRQVVGLLRDRVALFHLPDVGGDQLEWDPVVAQGVLVALEHPLRGVLVLLTVGVGKGLADLLEGHGDPRLEQERDQVQQALERLHVRHHSRVMFADPGPTT